MALLRELIQPALLERCGDRSFPVLSMTMHDGIMLQSDRFKKSLASVDQSAYKVVRRNQLVVGFPIDEGVLYIQQVADAGIMSPAYDVWNVDETKVNLQYFELCLHSPQSMMFYKTNLRGTTARRRSLPKETLLSLPVPVPSVERQREIASTIGRLKELIELRQRQLRTLDTLIKARFVEFSTRWESDYGFEPLSAFLQDITYGFTNPMPDAESGPWKVTAKDVVNGHINFETARRTTQEAYDTLTDKSKPSIGSILLTKDGSLGRTAIVEDDNICVNQSVAVLIANKRVLPQFLEVLFRTPYYQKEMLKDSGGGTIKHIYITKVNKMMVVVPSIAEQVSFMRFVSQVDKSKLSIQQSLEKLETLKQSLMQQYFG